MRQEDVAAALGVKQASVSRWEKDVNEPELADLNRMYEIFSGKGLNPTPPPVIRNAGRAGCPLKGHVAGGGDIRYADGAERVDVPVFTPGPADAANGPVVAYRVETEALSPFGQGWILFAEDHKAGSNPFECRDTLCVVCDQGVGTVLGWLRALRGGYMLERINAPAVALESLVWVEKVIAIRTA